MKSFLEPFALGNAAILGNVCMLPLYPGMFVMFAQQSSNPRAKRWMPFLGLMVLAGVLVLLVAVGLWAVLTGPATTEFGWTAQQVFIRTNLFMIALNLLPFPPLDGARAWKILPMLRGRFRPRVRRAPPPPKLRLVKPPPVRLDDVDDEPLSEESRRIADRAIQEALEQSRRKGQNGSGKPTLH